MVTQIADMSIAMSQAQTKQAAGMQIMKMAMNNAASGVEDLMQALDAVKAMQLSVQPNLGATIDLNI
jgi:hypothetical protein